MVRLDQISGVDCCILMHHRVRPCADAGRPEAGHACLLHEEPMLQRQLTLLRLPAIDRPECPHCGAKMMIARIEPAAPRVDRHTFECDRCYHSETALVQFG